HVPQRAHLLRSHPADARAAAVRRGADPARVPRPRLEGEPAVLARRRILQRLLHARAALSQEGGAMTRRVELIVIGGSAGAIQVLREGLRQLARAYGSAVAIVIHLPPDGPNLLTEVLSSPGSP